MGGKRGKSVTSEQPVAPSPAAPTDFELAEARLAATEASLLKARAGLEDLIDRGVADSATYRELGSIARALTQLEVERRSQRKLRDAHAQSHTVESVLTWARSQSADKRAHLARELAAIDAGGSVLA